MKFFYPHVKAINAENRRITVCISMDEIDRHNERIEISAIAEALKGYTANSVVLGDHQHRLATGESSVIGHAPPDSFKVLADAVDMDIVFSTTKNAETYWINFRDGHQKAVSIGFIDLEWRFEKIDGRKIYVTTKLELLELSCVAVPANRGALIKAKGMFDRQAVEKDEQPSAFPDKLNSVLEGIEDIKSLLITDSDRFAEELLLGEHSGPSVLAGDNNAEQSFERMKNALNFGDKDNVD